jgi:hypothetical protein
MNIGLGAGNRTGSATTTNKTEWRLKYRRKQRGSANAPAIEEIPGLEISDELGAEGSANDGTLVSPP